MGLELCYVCVSMEDDDDDLDLRENEMHALPCMVQIAAKTSNLLQRKWMAHGWQKFLV